MDKLDKIKLYFLLGLIIVLIVFIFLTFKAFTSSLNANSIPVVSKISSLPAVNPQMKKNEINNIQNQWVNIKKPVYSPDDTNFINSPKVNNILSQISNLKANSPYSLNTTLNNIPGIMNETGIVSDSWWKTNPNVPLNLQSPTLILQLKQMMDLNQQIINIIRIIYNDNISTGIYYQLLYFTAMYTNAYLQMRYLINPKDITTI